MFKRSWQAKLSTCYRMETTDVERSSVTCDTVRVSGEQGRLTVEAGVHASHPKQYPAEQSHDGAVETVRVKPGVLDNHLLSTRGNNAEERGVKECESDKYISAFNSPIITTIRAGR